MPKSRFPELALARNNLGLCCPRCNTNKGIYWTDDADLLVLNPFTDNIDEHIQFIGPMVVSKHESKRAENTIRKLRLAARDDLFIARARRIQELDTYLLRWLREPRRLYKELYAEDILGMISRESEYSGALRAYAETRGFAFPSVPAPSSDPMPELE